MYAHALLMDKRAAQNDSIDTDIRYSRRYVAKKDPTYWVPELGKNVTSLKIWMSNQMYADLEALARHSSITVSQYVREIVISRLLGHGTLPKRPEMLEAVPLPWAERWEAGQDVQMRQVTFEEYQRHDDGRVDD